MSLINIKKYPSLRLPCIVIPRLGILFCWLLLSQMIGCSSTEEKQCTIESDSVCFCTQNPASLKCKVYGNCSYEESPQCFCESNPADSRCKIVGSNLSPVERYGQLSIQGHKMLDKDRQPVQLQGMSFFWSQWMGKYYNAQAVKWLKDDWRVTVVRAAMGIEYDGYLTNPEIEKQKIKAVVDAAISEGLYVIIDWHDHHAEDHLKESKSFFAEMAKSYGDKPNVIYELYNEPLAISWSSVLKPYHQAVIDTIRLYDKDNLIVCGTPNWSQDVDKAAMDPLSDSNVIYTLHYYAATHKQKLRDQAAAALGKGIALMVTEYGTCEATGSGYLDELEAKKWYNFMDEYRISSCNWSIADKDETASILKPGASASGGWPDSKLTTSAILVRTYLRSKNPTP
jgi:endoglucanase